MLFQRTGQMLFILLYKRSFLFFYNVNIVFMHVCERWSHVNACLLLCIVLTQLRVSCRLAVALLSFVPAHRFCATYQIPHLCHLVCACRTAAASLLILYISPHHGRRLPYHPSVKCARLLFFMTVLSNKTNARIYGIYRLSNKNAHTHNIMGK